MELADRMVLAYRAFGEVAPTLSEFAAGNLLPSVGAGLRFMVSEANRVNISVDYARGKEGDGVYFYIGEAFRNHREHSAAEQQPNKGFIYLAEATEIYSNIFLSAFSAFPVSSVRFNVFS